MKLQHLYLNLNYPIKTFKFWGKKIIGKKSLGENFLCEGDAEHKPKPTTVPRQGTRDSLVGRRPPPAPAATLLTFDAGDRNQTVAGKRQAIDPHTRMRRLKPFHLPAAAKNSKTSP